MSQQIMDYDKDKGWYYRPIKECENPMKPNGNAEIWLDEALERESKMEFLKERCYTSLNADELKQGDKVIVADTMAELANNVEHNAPIAEIFMIYGATSERRFVTDLVDGCPFALAYLVERKENCTNCPKRGTRSCYHADKVSNTFCCEDYPKTEPRAEKKCLNCPKKGTRSCYHSDKVSDTFCCEDYPNSKAEKHYRPFKDVDELIKVWDAKIGTPNWGTDGDLTMPHIWVRQKECNKGGLLITYFGEDEVKTDVGFMTMNKLLSDYTFTDGTPCGVEE